MATAQLFPASLSPIHLSTKGILMNRKSLLAAALLGLSLVPAAYASDDHKPKYGGIVAAGKEFDAELVAKPEQITVHLDDHGKPMSTKGATAKIVLLTSADNTEVALTPAGESQLEAKGKFNVAKGTKAVLTVTLANKKTGTARFEIK